MITRELFSEIDAEIKNAITEILDRLKALNESDYVLFLANGEYVKEYENNPLIPNPYCIDYRVDGYRDITRLNLLSEFMSSYYSFSNAQHSTDDNGYRMNLELMIYTHIWESKSFLKKLYRIAHLLNGEEYDWRIQVPDMSKHDFIRCHIRQIFKDKGLHIWEVIKNGFHTSLRNAFAHSEYSFNITNNHNRINLYNYSGANWELKTIPFDEWSNRFVYSVLLSYHFSNLIHERRINIVNELGTNSFQIKHPKTDGEVKLVEIEYRQDGNGFNFKR